MSDTPQPDAYTQLFKAFTQMGETLSACITDTWERIQPVVQAISNAMWQAYRNDGMPYGDSQEGLLKWLEDMGEIRRHEMEIERLQQRLDTLIAARKLGERIRAKRR